jgi:hypothetical protein
MSTIHFIGGEKGGVGKSMVARLLSQYCLDQQLPHIGFDADASHATLTRYYGDYTQPLRLDDFSSIDQIVEVALEEEQQIIIDLPAQSERFLNRWIDDNDALNLCEESGIRVVYWYVTDDGRDSAQLTDAFVNTYGDKVALVVVQNAGRGQDFSELNAKLDSNAQAAAAIRMTLPALHAPTLRKIEKCNFSFWAGINLKAADAPHLSIMERQRTRVWQRKAYAAFEGALAHFMTAQQELTSDEFMGG